MQLATLLKIRQAELATARAAADAEISSYKHIAAQAEIVNVKYMARLKLAKVAAYVSTALFAYSLCTLVLFLLK